MIQELSRIIKESGKLLLKWRELRIFEGRWEGAQFKAKVDLMAHRELEKQLKKLTPDTFIISEENIDSFIRKRPKYYWMVDPIDGTASFVKGYPGFVTQAAFMEDNKPKLAAIYAPALNEFYTAEFGKGAYLNNRKIRVATRRASKTLIDNYSMPRGIAEDVFREFNFKNYIECGSISLKTCRVADGTADLFIKDVAVKDWDLAAPQLVLNEAGGFLTDIYGKEIEYCGNYEHKGLIAARSKKECMKLTLWHSNLKKGGYK